MKSTRKISVGPTCPLRSQEVLDLYFIEHRARLVDLAAFLDRIDRARDPSQVRRDHRLLAFRKALRILLEAQPGRARRVLESLSDPTTRPIPKAGMKGATGAYPGAIPAARTGGKRS